MKIWMFMALIGIAASAHGADMYRWVDEKGVVNYTTYPPPANIKNVEEKKFGGGTTQTGNFSYSLQLAIKNFPITLYVTDCGELCVNARAHLARRGIPYAEKNPQKPEETDEFKKLTGGSMQVPLLVVGRLTTVKGYQASEWDAALDLAGYPSSAPPGAKPAAAPPAPSATRK
jgi:glutaredoxin